MPKYTFTQTYRSSYGAGSKGESVELSEQQAADINRDAPGTLEPADAPETRAVDTPPADRMVKQARTRGDRGNEQPIDKATYKAVKDR